MSLEARVPLLDHRVVEFAWRLPRSMKIRGGVSKWAAAPGAVPARAARALIERPKMGFGIPLGAMAARAAARLGGGLLDETRLRAGRLFRPGADPRRWREHLSGRRNRQYALWDVLMFQAWLEHQRGAA